MRYSTLLIASLVISSVIGTCTNFHESCSDDCVTAGFLQDSKNPLLPCQAKTDCLSLYCGGNTPSQACLLLGYVPNPATDNNANKCIAPSYSDCTNPNNQQCKVPLNYCMASLQLVQDGTSGNCILPTDSVCITANKGLCKEIAGYCSYVLQYKKANNNDCVIVPDTDCISEPYCKNAKSYCVVTGQFSKGANGACNFNFTKCQAPSTTYCSSNTHTCVADFGFVKSGSSDLCVAPTDNDCLNYPTPLCKGNSYCSSILGYKKGSSNECLIVPEADCISASYCKDPKSYCVVTRKFSQGVNGACAFNDAKCITASTTYCSVNTHPCVTDFGYVKATSSDLCVVPSDCKAASAGLCGSKKTYCLSRGYTKAGQTDDCICDATKNTESGNKCTSKVFTDTTTSPSNAILIKASLILLISALFF